MPPAKPEEAARKVIDAALEVADWVIQGDAETNPYAAQRVAVREFVMAPGRLEGGQLALRGPEGGGGAGCRADRPPTKRQSKKAAGA